MKLMGKTVDVEQQGEGDAVLAIRGPGGTGNVWFAQRAVLGRSFRVISPSDTRGDEDGGGDETPGREDSAGKRRRSLPAADTGRRLSARARSTSGCSPSISVEAL
jgi:hypothetical protein